MPFAKIKFQRNINEQRKMCPQCLCCFAPFRIFLQFGWLLLRSGRSRTFSCRWIFVCQPGVGFLHSCGSSCYDSLGLKQNCSVSNWDLPRKGTGFGPEQIRSFVTLAGLFFSVLMYGLVHIIWKLEISKYLSYHGWWARTQNICSSCVDKTLS